MVGMVREVSSRTESNNYLLVDKKGNIAGATPNFLKETGLMSEHFSNYLFNISIFCPELKTEISGINKMYNRIHGRKERKPKKTLVFAKEQSTSSNMLKMMKMNHKLLNQKTVSSANESSDEEQDLKNSNEYFSVKLKVPMNIKELLNEYTKTLLTRLSTVKEATTEDTKKKNVRDLFGKVRKKNLA